MSAGGSHTMIAITPRSLNITLTLVPLISSLQVMITETAIQGQVVGYASKAKQKDERDDDEVK